MQSNVYFIEKYFKAACLFICFFCGIKIGIGTGTFYWYQLLKFRIARDKTHITVNLLLKG